jgi:hypothetical protein
MNDFLVSFLTTVAILAIIYIRKPKEKKSKIKYRQSSIHHIIGPFLPDLVPIDVKDTQLTKRNRESIIDVLITEDYAYWVHKNIFYKANVEDGHVDRSTTSPVNTEGMSEEELKKMLNILDKLTDRSRNEGRGSGDK